MSDFHASLTKEFSSGPAATAAALLGTLVPPWCKRETQQL